MADAAAASGSVGNLKLPLLKRVVIGGSAVPERILRAFEENYDVEVVHAWGMTEMSPLGSLGSMTETP